MKKLDADQEVACDGYNVRLPLKLARKARKIGGGNLSAGIRRALERTPADEKYMGEVAVTVPCRSCE